MTRTERLLSSTLAEEAATTTRENLRPLTGPAKELEFQGSGLKRSCQRWLRPLTAAAAAAAAAAAVSVLLVIGLVVVARSLFTAAQSFANVGTATSPPRYYVEIDVNDKANPCPVNGNRRSDSRRQVPVRDGGGRCPRSVTRWAHLRRCLYLLGHSANQPVPLYRHQRRASGALLKADDRASSRVDRALAGNLGERGSNSAGRHSGAFRRAVVRPAAPARGQPGDWPRPDLARPGRDWSCLFDRRPGMDDKRISALFWS